MAKMQTKRKITNRKKHYKRFHKKTLKRRTRRGGVAPPQQPRTPPRSPQRNRPSFMEPEPIEVDMGDISMISEDSTNHLDNSDLDLNLDLSFDNENVQRTGGKKTRRNQKRRNRKYVGGANVGCNNTDPNYSIYNTNMLQLFPYVPK